MSFFTYSTLMDLIKMQIPPGRVASCLRYYGCLATIGVCVFCAPASVGALFFYRRQIVGLKSHDNNEIFDIPKTCILPVSIDEPIKFSVELKTPPIPFDLYSCNYMGEKVQRFIINEIGYFVIEDALNIKCSGTRIFKRKDVKNSNAYLTWTLTTPNNTRHNGFEYINDLNTDAISFIIDKKINESGTYLLNIEMN